MIKYFRENRCPVCESPLSESHRIRRKFWMRLLPRTCYYRCNECYSKFVTVLGCMVVVVYREW